MENWLCVLVLGGIAVTLYGCSLIAGTGYGPTRSRVRRGVAAVAVLLALGVVATVASSVMWLIPILIVAGMTTVYIARLAILGHAEAGTNPVRPQLVSLATAVGVPMVVAVIPLLARSHGAVWEGLFCSVFTATLLVLLAYGYEPPQSTRAQRRANRAAVANGLWDAFRFWT